MTTSLFPMFRDEREDYAANVSVRARELSPGRWEAFLTTPSGQRIDWARTAPTEAEAVDLLVKSMQDVLTRAFTKKALPDAIRKALIDRALH